MEQFNLNKWLQDKNRKVITRDGREVRIICWDLKCSTPIIAAIQWNQEREDCYCYNTVGRCANNVSEIDLFFADDEEELTEFEKELQTIISEASHWTSDDGSISTYCQFGDKEIKKISVQILDLARKEIKEGAVKFAKSYMEDVNPSFEKVQESEELWKWKMSCLNGVNKAYTKGKEDALKSLPKWKKVPSHEKQTMYGMSEISDVYYNGYFIHLDDIFKALPKED